MANANPIIEALIGELAGRLGDVDAVQLCIDLVRPEIDEYAALHAEAAAHLAQADRRLAEVAISAAARRGHALQDQEPPEGLALALLQDDPEVAAHAAACVEAEARVELIRRHELLLVEGLAFLVASRAVSLALNRRVHLLPRVLVRAAAAYALAYVVSCGAVVAGPTSILWIAVLVLCFLLGIPVVGNLP